MEDNNIAANVAAVVAASEHALAAASNAPTPAAAPSGYRPLTAVELFVVLNRRANPKDASEREAAEKAYKRFIQYDLAAALPGAANEEVMVPPGAPPGVSTQEDTALPEAAPKGAEPPGLVTQATNVLLAAPPDQTTQEAVDLPTAAQKDPMFPEANLEQLLLHEEGMDVALPSRKRPASTDEDEPPASAPSSVHRLLQKKKQHAPEAATDEEAAQEEEGEFVVPKRRHTARAKVLEIVAPLQTTNSFAAVQDNEDMETGQAPIKRAPAPPPITIQWQEDYESFLQLFKDVPSLTVKTQGRDLLKTTIAELTQELRSAKAASATAVDTASQTTPPREKKFATVATQTDVPAEGEATLPKTDAEAQEEGWEEVPFLPLPDMYSASAVTQKIAASLRDGTYPHHDNPYPFVPPNLSKPSPPHQPIEYPEGLVGLSKEDYDLINSFPIFTEWQMRYVIFALVHGEYEKAGYTVSTIPTEGEPSSKKKKKKSRHTDKYRK
ncbi:uncharacterized protein LOC124587232 [Schistocerca americana]|uniref:uncharacterized protein LOC124587232 n=1 Tax=Schistocerca americana TaxID=7009 RepID=UPI001F4FA116|nr:uncharacterized protein LOC124587232 [Schistocerca americana]